MSKFQTPLSRRSVLAGAAAIVAAAPLVACGGSEEPAGSAAGSAAETQTLTVGASPSPHAVILNDYAAPLLAEQGIELTVEEYTDYIQPNRDTTNGTLDANSISWNCPA